MKTLPDLQAWAIFATVAETGSFAQAAEVLGLSQPTVSKAIARLEKQLNISLFHRTSRRLSLTETGLASLEQAQTVLAAGQGAEALARDQRESLQGRIKIAAPMSFGLEHLAPLLPAFMKQHPAVLLDLHFNDAQVNIVEQGFDMALRISTMDDSSLLVRRLCNLRLRLVAAPAYSGQLWQAGAPQRFGPAQQSALCLRATRQRLALSARGRALLANGALPLAGQ